MIFETHKPNSSFGKHIESFMYFKDFIPEHSLERVIPTGHVFIIFELDNIIRNTFDNVTLEPIDTFREVWVSGAHKNFITISAHKHSEMFVIQFKPAGAFPFFHFPLTGISNSVLPAQEIFGNEIIDLRQKLIEVSDVNSKFEVAEEWLASRYDESKQLPREFSNILKKVELELSASDFDNLFEGYPFTRKHLIDQFKKYVGLTPKYYQRIIKFNDILKKIQKKKSITWTQLTYEYGYSDQAHFIKTFKHFSGFSPKEFIFEGLDENEANFFPIDKKG